MTIEITEQEILELESTSIEQLEEELLLLAKKKIKRMNFSLFFFYSN